MALLKGFPPARLIGCTIRIKPGDLEYTLLPEAFLFANAGPSGFVFDVECIGGPTTLDRESLEPRYLTTRIVVRRDGGVWPIWGPSKEHIERVIYSAKYFVQELTERGEMYEAFYERCRQRQEWDTHYYVAVGTVFIGEESHE